MKTYSANLQWELTRSASKLATCMRIERSDGQIFGFTTNRKSLTIGGIFYEPAASFNPSDIASANNLDTDNLTVNGFLDSDAITEDELRAGRWDFAQFRIFQVNWADLTMGDKKDRKGHLGECTVNRLTFVTELLGLMEAYGTSIGWITQPGCRNNFGDAKCKYSLTGSPSLSFNGTITLCGTDFFTLTDPARTEPDGYFDEGTLVIHYSNGDLSYEVKSYIVGLWVTKTPVAYNATGVDYTITRGCRKRLQEDCRDTYGNAVNFNGEPWLRGNDVLVQVGRHP